MPNLAAATNLHGVGAPGRYDVQLDAEWTANGHCTAGYLASLTARAVLADAGADFTAPVAITARYLRVTTPGYATVNVDPLRIGTSGADWLVTLNRHDRPCVAALVRTGNQSDPDHTRPPPDLPAQHNCAQLPTQAPGFDLPIMGVVEQYADPAGLTWLAGEPSGHGVAQGWVQLADGARPDALVLIAVFDSIPTATYDLGLEDWAATVDLSIHLLGLPAPGPLRLHRRVHATAGQLVTLHCDIWDADARHVATGTQLCTLPS
jgi:acyl-coenzyme A thioesterase PaaI-like protein